MAEIKNENSRPQRIKFSTEFLKGILYKFVIMAIVFVAWQLYATSKNNPLIMPKFTDTIKQFALCLTDSKVISNILITLLRVLKGFLWALVVGVPLGFLMGVSEFINKLIGGFVDSIRQVPIMAWVPLTIVWFGIGDGPTIFLIAFSGVFPIILNTIQGVRNISKDYYYAAKSMGASKVSIFKDIIVPATLPDILTGARIAIGGGWMSVIWAEFIATSQGLGFLMVDAQTMMQTDRLIALMFLAAIVGFIIDRGLKLLNNSLTKWRLAE